MSAPVSQEEVAQTIAQLAARVEEQAKIIERLNAWHDERDDEDTAREVEKHRTALAVVLPWLEQYAAKHNPQAAFAAKLVRDTFARVFGPEVLP